mmetsp:Transcript_2511/g.9694  ORF Transcript_2511/g.9694 Transcript_2511/m.9694 type:complete len:811 (-) Transcript_2511:203-2635(-)
MPPPFLGGVGAEPPTPTASPPARCPGAGRAIPDKLAEISCSIIKLALPSRSACSVLNSLTHSRSSAVEPTSRTVPSLQCSMMGIADGFGVQLSTTSTNTTSSCSESCSASVRLFPRCHSHVAAPSSIMTYLYSYVSSACMGVVTVHRLPSVHRMGKLASTSQSFHVPTIATRCPGTVSTTISNLTGIAEPWLSSVPRPPLTTRPMRSLCRIIRAALVLAICFVRDMVSSSKRMLVSISQICAPCCFFSSASFSVVSADERSLRVAIVALLSPIAFSAAASAERNSLASASAPRSAFSRFAKSALDPAASSFDSSYSSFSVSYSRFSVSYFPMDSTSAFSASVVAAAAATISKRAASSAPCVSPRLTESSKASFEPNSALLSLVLASFISVSICKKFAFVVISHASRSVRHAYSASRSVIASKSFASASKVSAAASAPAMSLLRSSASNLALYSSDCSYADFNSTRSPKVSFKAASSSFFDPSRALSRSWCNASSSRMFASCTALSCFCNSWFMRVACASSSFVRPYSSSFFVATASSSRTVLVSANAASSLCCASSLFVTTSASNVVFQVSKSVFAKSRSSTMAASLSSTRSNASCNLFAVSPERFCSLSLTSSRCDQRRAARTRPKIAADGTAIASAFCQPGVSRNNTPANTSALTSASAGATSAGTSSSTSTGLTSVSSTATISGGTIGVKTGTEALRWRPTNAAAAAAPAVAAPPLTAQSGTAFAGLAPTKALLATAKPATASFARCAQDLLCLVLPSRKVETGATGGSTHLLSWGTSVVVTKNSPPAERATTVARLVPGKPRDEKS